MEQGVVKQIYFYFHSFNGLTVYHEKTRTIVNIVDKIFVRGVYFKLMELSLRSLGPMQQNLRVAIRDFFD